MEVISGFLIGILGSLHCLGMCGPIALAIPHKNNSNYSIITDNLTYNFGRVITYSILGLILGLLGTAISFTGIQEKLSIVIGIIMLILTFAPKLSPISKRSTSYFYKLVGNLKAKFNTLLTKKGKPALLGLGILNGLLPCGLVYVALAASLGIANYWQSLLFMFGFGLGTIPAMFGIKYIGNYVSPKLKRKFSKLLPYGIAIVAIMMIIRGMALGIPYLSPELPNTVQTENVKNCCH